MNQIRVDLNRKKKKTTTTKKKNKTTKKKSRKTFVVLLVFFLFFFLFFLLLFLAGQRGGMGGTRLEMFRFGVYVFVPIGFFYYFNLPGFYNKHIKPELVRTQRAAEAERRRRNERRKG